MKLFGQFQRTMLVTLLFLCSSWIVLSEGTRELAPNQNTVIGNNTSNDVAALHIANPQFNNFAAYSNTDVTSRLNIHISDPSIECIFLGFSEGHLNRTTANPPPQDFEYRIKDPNGNIVFGPVSVLSGDADIQTWAQAFNGPSALSGPSGYGGVQVNPSELLSGGWTGRGDYYIEFRNLSSNDPFLIDYWDITVADCSSSMLVEKKGRIWSNNWALFAINDFGFPNRPFNGAFFVCAPDPTDEDAAFITRIDFNGSGFRPAAFNVAFNSFGTMNTGVIAEARRSVENRNVTEPEYPIFLNDPVDICRTAQGGDVQLLGISSCDGESFCIKFVSTRPGQIDLFLDFDGADMIFTPGTADIAISATVDSSQVGREICIDWDGKDGLGQSLVGTMTEVPVNFSFAQGIYHFPIYDAELMTQGFEITAVRPPGPDPLLYYDDSNISVSSGTGEPVVQLSGCDLPCHGWTNYTEPGTVGFGNLNTINSWWFSTRQSFESVFILPGTVECVLSGASSICSGDSIYLSVKHEMVPPGSGFEITAQRWIDAGTGSLIAENTDSILITTGGSFLYEFEWVNASGDSCSNAMCQYTVEAFPSFFITVDTLIAFGDSIEINGDVFVQEGSYIQEFSTEDGCDSIVIIKLEFEDPFYTCEIIGEEEICFGDTSVLELVTFLDPPGDVPPAIQDIVWTGPGLSGVVSGESIRATRQGTYKATVTWLDSAGEEQSTSCSFFLDLNPRFAMSIDTLITEGDTLEVENIIITEPGAYSRVYQTINGCDSTIFINVISQNAVVRYKFDDCKSIDYDRFTPEYPSPVICAEFNAGNVFRVNPEVNAHSCTPGIAGGVAMCISSLDDCSYDAGNDKSLIFELEVRPHPDSAIQVTSLDFYERAPENFSFVVGFTGVNNYPLFYGLRVLKDGTEIYRRADIATTRDWTREVFSFADLDAFLVESPATFRFELLPYCLSGADSYVTAWDIDELSVQASCALGTLKKAGIAGRVTDRAGVPMAGLTMHLESPLVSMLDKTSETDEVGAYHFDVSGELPYILKPESPADFTNGLSAIDLIIIQRHILGKAPFKDAYDFIAADANASKSITVTDILELQKLILGIQQDLPGNTSWRFNASPDKTSLDQPWSIREEKAFDFPLQSLQHVQDFDAIKIGDLNGDAYQSPDTNKKRQKLSLRIPDLYLDRSGMCTVPLQIEAGQAIAGLQFTLNLGSLRFMDIASELFELSWNLEGQQLHVIVLDWQEHDSEILDITLQLSPEKTCLLSQELMLEKGKINEVFLAGQEFGHMLTLDFVSEQQLKNLRISPNPFSDQTELLFHLEAEDDIELQLYSSDGRLLTSRKSRLKPGDNTLEILAKDLGAYRGLILGRLEAAGISEKFRMIRL